MPKPPRSPRDVEAVREDILSQAVDMMFHEGFDQLSMRKLASRLDMTAANIYNYFKNKDELYLAIQKQGFDHLHGLFSQSAGQAPSPVEKLRRCARVYLAFGLENPALYDIMFNRHGPKYSDYVDTASEPAALAEKLAALNVLGVVEKIVQDWGAVNPDRAWPLLMQAWITLHGYVTLFNTRTLQEVEDDPQGLAETLMVNFLAMLQDGPAASPVPKEAP